MLASLSCWGPWQPDREGQFEAFVRLLREHGSDEVFKGRTYRYLDLDGSHYRTMGAPVEETTAISRKPFALSTRR